MWGVLTLFVIIDGVVTRNPQPWAAPVRAGLAVALFLIGVVWLWRAGIRFSPIASVLIGILAALIVSDVAQNIGTGISSWSIYAGVFAAQRLAKRDWRADLATMGVILGALWIAIELTGHLSPPGMWHKNVMGGVMAATLPAAAMLAGWRRPVYMIVICVGIVCSLSRGAMLGGAVGLAILFQPWALLAAPVLMIGLILWPGRGGWELNGRLRYFYEGIQLIRNSPWFGVGPRYTVPPNPIDDVVGIHVHNTLLGLVAQVGGVGVAVIAMAGALARKIKIERWQLATLLAVAAHSLVDDPLCWWPVGVILGLVWGDPGHAENM